MPIVTGSQHSVVDLDRNVTRPIFKQKAGTITADVETADLAAGSVTSEKASTPLVTRSAVGATPDPAAGTGFGTTSFTVQRLSVRAEVVRVALVPLTAFSAVTSGGNLQLWSCYGEVATFTFCSTAIGPVGVPIIMTLGTYTCLAACQDIMLGASSLNACDNVPALSVLIDYKTSE